MTIKQPKRTLSFEEEAVNRSISARFKQVVSAFPDRIAVKSTVQSLTYRQMDQLAHNLAQCLRLHLGDNQEPVGLLLKNGINIIAGILGVINSGKFYCALNPSDPAHRIKNILEDLRPHMLITDKANQDLALQIAPVECVTMIFDELKAEPGKELPHLELSPASLAGIFYTSGSTGAAKGVPRDHGTILHRSWVDAMDLGINIDDRFLLLRWCGFSGSLADIFDPLLNGASLYVQDIEDLNLNSLPNVIQKEKFTFFHPPIELFRYLIDSLPADSFFPHIRCLILTGDVLYKKDVERVRHIFPKEVVIVHQLSSSETGVLARFLIHHDTRIEGDIVPVGYPVPGKELLVLGEEGQILAAGQTGEIAVRSQFGFIQYWKKPEQTDKKFVSDPDNPNHKIYLTGDLGQINPAGQLEFVGRKDFQVKIRGFRVDLSAIENALMTIEEIKRSVVVVRPDSDGEKRLVAYVSFRKDVNLSPADLQSMLAETLPDYMIPGAIVSLQDFPLTPTGKIDRQSLPEPMERAEQIDSEPRDDLEKQLAGIWKQVLGLKKVGIDEPFSMLGGHSLSALRIIALIQKDISPGTHFEALIQASTIAQQAEVIRNPQDSPNRSYFIPIQTEGSLPPFFCVSPTVIDVVTYRDLSRALGQSQPFYALYAPKRVKHRETDPHDQISMFLEAVRRIQPSGPYYLGGYSGGGRVAIRMAHRLQIQGEQVGLVVLLDAFAPNYPVRLPWVTPGLYNFLRVLRRVQSYLWKFWILDLQGKRNLLLSGERPFHSRFHDWISKRRQELNRPVTVRMVQSTGNSMDTELRDYSGKVVLLRARQGLLGVNPNPTLGWNNYLSSPPEIKVIAGDHESILFGPRTARVARILNNCLEQATLRTSTSEGGRKNN
jgi:amino acid adenylation domain-containing protein